MADTGMLKRLEEVEIKYLDIEKSLNNPEISPTEIHKFSKELSDLEEIIGNYRKYKKVNEELESNKALLGDKEVGELAQIEVEGLTKEQENLENTLKLLMLPKDPNDGKNVFL